MPEYKGRLWPEHKDLFLTFFDAPWADVFQGLNMPRPLFFKGVTEKGSMEYRDFETLNEVNKTEHIVEIVAIADKIIFDLFNADVKKLRTVFLYESSLNDVSEIRSISVFLTVLAMQILYGKTELVALTSDELMKFIEKVFNVSDKKDDCCLNENISAQTISWICSLGLIDEQCMPALKSFVDRCLSVLEEEFSSLFIKKNIDIRYVNAIILKAAKQ